jgi:mitogen-activated protein kinase kinase
MKRKNVKGLALAPAPPKPPPTAENAYLGPGPGAKNDDNAAQLEIGIEYNLDLRPEDLEIIKDLGAGNGGSVSKVRHISTDTVMARKVNPLPTPSLPFPTVYRAHRPGTDLLGSR